MLLRLVCAGSLVLAVSACRTPDEPGSSDLNSGIPPGAQGLPIPPSSDMKVLVSLEDEAAQGVYDGLNAEEQTDQSGGRKSYQGDVSISCQRNGNGGQIPPGAQGIVQPASYNCGIYPSGGANFPDGAQGIPPAPVLVLDGGTARAFHIAFKVQEFTNGGTGRKNFQGNVEINCQYTDNNGTRSAYNCQVRGETNDEGTTPPPDATLLTLTGNEAKLLFAKLKIQTVARTRQHSGDTVLHCEKHGFGGAIPPGAQGIVAAATFECRFIAPANIPDGAQGFPGPGKVLAKFDGSLGAIVFDALQIQTAEIEGGLLKEFDGEATVRCSYVVANGKKKYDCLIKQGLGGIPPGAQGLPIPQGG